MYPVTLLCKGEDIGLQQTGGGISLLKITLNFNIILLIILIVVDTLITMILDILEEMMSHEQKGGGGEEQRGACEFFFHLGSARRRKMSGECFVTADIKFFSFYFHSKIKFVKSM